jgi:hypothetical protein
MIDMLTPQEQLQQLNMQVVEAQQAILKLAQEQGKPIVFAALQPLFDLGIKQVYWTQFTPYFNDGEPCEFAVHDMFFSKGEELFEDYPDDDVNWTMGWELEQAFKPFIPPQDTGWRKYSVTEIAQMEDDHIQRHQRAIELGYNEATAHQLIQVRNQAQAFLQENESLLEKAFGDHVSVLVKADGTFIVEDQDHD